ncbi:MAG: hypothetical protein PHT84_02440 [Candidatus Pacebacteria bacterium]|nr:hypothetical protein [Candidatus Paceibacterota bacterium]
MENFLGKKIDKATFSSPVSLVGFDKIPEVGNIFKSFNTKKEAEKYINENKELADSKNKNTNQEEQAGKIIPLIIKTDVFGSFEAIEKEIKKINTEEIYFKIINNGVGPIGESDLKMANASNDSIIVGFNVKIDNSAIDLSESLKINIQTFDIIYKLTDWLKEILEERRPKVESVEIVGTLKVLKTFGETKNKKVIGGKVTSGQIKSGGNIKIMRRDFELGLGKIVELQHNKIKVKEVSVEEDCGMMIESKVDIATGDVFEAFITTIK